MNEKKKVKLFVPGRLCLFGEHSDWAGLYKTMNSAIVPGHALVTGIEQGIYGEAVCDDSFSVSSKIEEFQGSDFSCPMEMSKLREVARKGGFFSYVAGVASYISEWYHVGGIHLEITGMDLPIKSGLSSSAAICVMVARAFNELYDLHLNTKGIMNIAYLGEQRTPSRCGRLDQACAYGVTPISMVFDGNELDVERITVKKPLHYVFADLMAGKDTVQILSDLNKAFPFADSEKEKNIHQALGADNEIIVTKAMECISKGDVEGLGKLMTSAQKLFDEKVAPMSPRELKAPVLHSVIDDEEIKKLTYGVKGVGSQGDGTVQLLAKDEETQKKLIEYLENVRKMTAYSLTLKPTKSVRKAVITVAGFGTRMYPFTRGVKKEFAPVLDKDGLVKPAILVLLEELDNIGIEEIGLVINHEEEEYYRNFFMTPLSNEHYLKLPENMKNYEQHIQKIGEKLHFIYQEEAKGFGHAVLQAEEFANQQPILLLLGDTIYDSFEERPCTKQLLDTYEQYGKQVVAVHRVNLDEVSSYGIFSGVWEDKEEKVLNLVKISEKPTIEYASQYLSVASRKHRENYYAAFGAYVIDSQIFDRLKVAAKENITNSKGEVELTDALEYVRSQSGMYAFVPDGESYDIGNPKAYRKTVNEFGKKI
ncbi:sugar phosphate nucleotidyltransferase [Butyrivibrio sp. NC3005]|uniref:sugar phosphate nucleotidyltransferase n=1 Tax=Butyrivibrio sp. NC3005 TaxID=1280685 RepID=UPI000406B9C2|nr:sugar phosphate nucleotidyltransferase [Butyrivibrio sp. NC3005]